MLGDESPRFVPDGSDAIASRSEVFDQCVAVPGGGRGKDVVDSSGGIGLNLEAVRLEYSPEGGRDRSVLPERSRKFPSKVSIEEPLVERVESSDGRLLSTVQEILFGLLSDVVSVTDEPVVRRPDPFLVWKFPRKYGVQELHEQIDIDRGRR
ncbi:hypothetical protein [Natrinema amylolyticum]|uniref:hypothetical protein n=1 Tax=Natrinema amylolyticum TaxID=2878679 RepID=UPI001CFB8D4F|nr:hypothetical protein [Natrinema amylolyticum]